MDYRKFRFKAVIDWIELEIKTIKPTNFQTIRRHGGLKYVTPIDEGAGRAATNFIFKFHDPKNWLSIIEMLKEIELDNSLAQEPIVKSIEVSFDAYSETATSEELTELTGRFFRYLTNPVSLNIRFSGRKGLKVKDTEPTESGANVRRLFAKNRNLCIGNAKDDESRFNKYKVDDEYMQIYFKKTDNNGIAIPTSEHRARIEIRLQGSKLPCTTFCEWREFNFESLSKYFNFRTINEPLLALAPTGFIRALDSIAQIGAASGYKRRKGALFTVADKELNNKVYESLRRLTDRMRTKRVG
jgi:hypothetical protein